MKVNVKLLKRLRTRFLRMRHVGHFDMTKWANRGSCGTAMCIAGHALDLQGYKTRSRTYESSIGNLVFLTPEGKPLRDSIPETAAREMGLDYNFCIDDLFNVSSGIRTPKQAAARIQELIESVEGVKQ